jgi:hypothetical protein
MSSEQKLKRFVRELDVWSDTNVIRPLSKAAAMGGDELEDAAYQAQEAIRAKVLEIYHNGHRRLTRAEINKALWL